MTVLPKALLNPACYNHPTASIECIETHISWIFLTGEFVYKLKKPLKLGFLDFSTLEKRLFYCKEELRLNRRFAPDLYLEVVPLLGSDEHPRFHGGGTAIDHAVKMRQFPQSALLDRILAAGELTPSRIDSIAREVAGFHLANHASCHGETPPKIMKHRFAMTASLSPYSLPEGERDVGSLREFHAIAPPGMGDPEHILQQAMDNFEQIRERDEGSLREFHANTLAALQNWSVATFAQLGPLLESRRQAGFIRECHGDLHLGNMAWLDEHPVFFDCIEFSPELRWIDIISDLAFAVMDIHDHGRPELARRFLNVWLEQTGDYEGLAVLPWYLVYRAMVRAKVSRLRSLSHSSFNGYLTLAERFTQPAPTWLLITHGYSGSGKTTLSQQVLEHTGAIRIRSDIERKRLFGLSPLDHSHSPTDQGIYTPEAHRMTFQRLETLARTIIQAGYPVIVDAAFLKRGERDAFHALADELSVPFLILELETDEAELRHRVSARARSGSDASEATLAVLERQLQFAERIDGDEFPFCLGYSASDTPENWFQRLKNRLS